MAKSLVLGLGLVAFSACTAGFEDINNPGAALSQEELRRNNYQIGSYIVQLQDQAFPEQENAYQMNYDLIGNYLGRYFTYANNGFSSKNFATFNAPDGWAAYPFRDMTPKVVSAFAAVKNLASTEDINYNWALILRAHALLSLTDKYGPFPMGLDEQNPSDYNAQRDIYLALIGDLDKAITNLQGFVSANPSTKVLASKDKMYGGDMSKWLKFAASLKLRMAIRMRFAEPTLAKKYAEEAVQTGVITAVADNAMMKYVPRGMYKTSVEWGDSRACADIDSYMNGYQDPRLSAYFKSTQTAGSRDVIGCLAGADVKDKKTAGLLYSAANTEYNTPSPWLTAAEMYFCRAEGALAGWSMGGTAQELYEMGVQSSFDQWGVSGADSYLESTNTPADYVDAAGGYGRSVSKASSITPQWDDNASDETKLERVITQKWIALFPNGQEAWNEIRRTGYPKVFAIPTSTNGYTIQVPNRIPFDVQEKVNNRAGYTKAVQTLGGADDYATKLWWQRR